MKLKRNINPDTERKLKDAVFVGKLADEEDLSGTLIKEPVYFKNELSDDVQFHIKCLSPIPKEVSKQFYYPNLIFTGSTISYNNERKLSDWIDFDKLHHFELVEKIKDFLRDKLVAFTFSVKPEMLYVELLQIEDIQPSDKGYTMIPGPHLKMGEELTEFESKLIGVRKPFTLKHYPHIFDLPELMYCKGTVYQVSLNSSINATTYSQISTEDVLFHSGVEEQFMNLVDMRIEDHLYFVEKDRIFDIRDLVGNSTLNEKNDIEVARQERKNQKEQQKGVHRKSQGRGVTTKYNKAEIQFINYLKDNTRKRGLYFDEKDLYAFHSSAKTNLITIIGGMSGTGKSQLAKMYGETMGLQNGNDLLMIPVSPTYHEPNDVLGFLNPTTGVYHESETGLVSLLLEAEESPEKMFMVIFDEMNLSQVEHWFSPFISILEVDEDERYLTLFNENSYCVNNKYKSKVRIRNNIIFVGTVNFDETTRDFSDRLLDRTNVIEPRKLTLQESVEMMKSQNSESGEKNIIPLSIQTSLYRKEWISNNKNTGHLNALTMHEINLLDTIHRMLNDSDRQKGVSFRVALGISRFLDNIPEKENGDSLLSRREAFDIQFTQRILTKIGGLSSFAEPFVGTINDDI